MGNAAWLSCGFEVGEDGIEGERRWQKSVLDILFTFTSSKCESVGCNRPTFIKCAHCRTNLCFLCFIINDLTHLHLDNNLEATILDYKNLKMVKETKKKGRSNIQDQVENDSNHDLEEEGDVVFDNVEARILETINDVANFHF